MLVLTGLRLLEESVLSYAVRELLFNAEEGTTFNAEEVTVQLLLWPAKVCSILNYNGI